MIELDPPPEVVAAEVGKLATEGSLGDLVRHISRRGVCDSTWLLHVSCEGGGSGSMGAQFTATETSGEVPRHGLLCLTLGKRGRSTDVGDQR